MSKLRLRKCVGILTVLAMLLLALPVVVAAPAVISIEDCGANYNTTVTVPINITGVTDLGAATIKLHYDKNVVIVDSVPVGDIGGFLFPAIDNESGVTTIGWFTMEGMTGDFVYAYVELHAVGSGGATSPLDLVVTELTKTDLSDIENTTDDGVFTVTPAADTTPPADVTALVVSSPTVSSLTLTWIAPGDDGSEGTASEYDIRYAGEAITEVNWASATNCTGEPVPQAAGNSESFAVTGLSSNTTYYFALKTADEVPNWSGLSNSPYGTTSSAADTTPPADVTDLAVGNSTTNSLTLTWTAPGDDGSEGTASEYDIRYAGANINNGVKWAAATTVTGEPNPSVAGSSESFEVTGLSSNTTYYFALKTADEVPNWSGLSNSPHGTTLSTPDTTPPADVTDLAVSSPTVNSLNLTWTAPGDDGSEGTASEYDIRYAGEAITEVNWASATNCTGEPVPQAAGNSESFEVTGLSSNTTYYFALKTADEVPNWSGLSNSPHDTTLAPVVPTVAFSLAAYSLGEGGGSATITVNLSAASAETVTVNYTSSDGTATAGSDYTAASGTLTFAPDDTSETFGVTILEDELVEGDETVDLSLSGASNATLGTPSTAVLTIVDNDVALLPTVAFSAAAYSVGEGDGSATITVNLSAASAETVTVNYTSSDGTATAGSDYTAASGTLTFAPDDTSETFGVTILEDELVEGNETVDLSLSDPSNATLGTPSTAVLTIVDNDVALLPTVAFSAAAYSVGEEGGSATITVNLSAASAETVTVDYASSDGTATAGSDYTAASGTLTFSPDETSKTFSVIILGDELVEGNETVDLSLSGASNATLGTPSTAVLTIVDDESGCFIATAAYGTDTAEELDILRKFRDEVMLPNRVGAELVSLYYRFSPPVADFISRHEVLRTIVRECFVDPLVMIVRYSM